MQFVWHEPINWFHVIFGFAKHPKINWLLPKLLFCCFHFQKLLTFCQNEQFGKKQSIVSKLFSGITNTLKINWLLPKLLFCCFTFRNSAGQSVDSNDVCVARDTRVTNFVLMLLGLLIVVANLIYTGVVFCKSQVHTVCVVSL